MTQINGNGLVFGYGGAVAVISGTGVDFSTATFTSNFVHGAGGAVAVVDPSFTEPESSQSDSAVTELITNITMETCVFDGNKAFATKLSARPRVITVCTVVGKGCSFIRCYLVLMVSFVINGVICY